MNYFNDPLLNIAWFLKIEFCEGCKFNYPSQKDHDFCNNNEEVYKWAEELIHCYKLGIRDNTSRFVSPYANYDVTVLFQKVGKIINGSKSGDSI